MKHQYDGDDLHCTAPRCRRVVDPGQGIQWVDPGGILQRFCSRCFVAMTKEEESRERV